MRNDEHDELDRILDSGIASYGEQQPWPGIEQRVIARLPRSRVHGGWLRWMVPVPVLAGVLIVMTYRTEPEAPVVQRTPPVEQRVLPQPIVTVAKIVRTPVRRKADVFPTPSPLTAEERALMQLAASNPEVLQNVQISSQSRNQPLTVEPINIPPLEKGDSMED